MSKRAPQFERKPRDFYPTPPEAIYPLLNHLSRGYFFDEPCAGNGTLIDTLAIAGHYCRHAVDIEPRGENIQQGDAFNIQTCRSGMFITNPPWDRKILHPLIIHLSDIAPTWLLFDADWVHTKQSTEYMNRCVKIVSVGRVKWIPDSKMTGKDNCAWHLFNTPDDNRITQFYGR